jgi:hypothetical protein
MAKKIKKLVHVDGIVTVCISKSYEVEVGFEDEDLVNDDGSQMSEEDIEDAYDYQFEDEAISKMEKEWESGDIKLEDYENDCDVEYEIDMIEDVKKREKQK